MSLNYFLAESVLWGQKASTQNFPVLLGVFLSPKWEITHAQGVAQTTSLTQHFFNANDKPELWNIISSLYSLDKMLKVETIIYNGARHCELDYWITFCLTLASTWTTSILLHNRRIWNYKSVYLYLPTDLPGHSAFQVMCLYPHT